jgi:hypothetical protein
MSAAGASATPAPSAPPTAESLGLASTLVEKTGTGGVAATNGLALPLPRLMHEMGIEDPKHFGVIMHEDVMSVMNDHSDALTDIQAKSYAALLSVEDLKAAIAFYDSPAGKTLVRLRFKLLQTNMAQANTLMQTLKPEIEAKTQETLKAHGWTKG